MRNRILLAMTTLVVSWNMHIAQAGLSPLEALGMIESGNNDQAVGSLGEISRYQILPRVWRSYSRSWNYRNLEHATEVAEKHLTFLEVNFMRRAGREPTDFDRYVLWNAGLTYYARVGFSPSRVASVIRERASRYVNLRHMVQPVASSR
jgi:hypothetical protein